jgi:UDPglucose 6-dehydrogenase
MLSAICERLPGADVDTVTGALGRDSRIGRRYLTGGLGYGGPCFPRDNQALAFMAKTLGCRATVAEATDAQNKSWCASIVNRITSLVPRDKRIAILGLSYKPGTNVIEESQPLAIARALVAQGYKLIVFDACALENVSLVLRDNVSYARSVTECLDLAEAVIIANDGEELKKLRGIDFPQREERVIVFDCWRILQSELPQVDWVKYVPLGVGENELAVSARLADVWQTSAAG